MRILFSFVGGSGHFHPLVPIARAAEAAGHIVAVAGGGAMVPTIAAAGFTAFATSDRRPEPPPRKPLLELDPEREEHDLREYFAFRGAMAQAPAILALAGEWQPDVIVRDEVDFGAAIAAEKSGIPCVTVLVLAAGGFLRTDVVAGRLDEVRAEFGLAADPDLAALHRDLVLSPFPPSFRDPAFPLPANTFSFRQQEAVDQTATDQPTVYFTLGTVFNTESGDLFSRVLTGLGDLPANVIATVGEHIDPAEFGSRPAHVRIERYVPQAALLPQCDLVVSHGGSGSVVGALSHGLPSILIPMGADQPHNARRCVTLGTGLALDPVTASPEEVHTAASTVLAEPSYRTAAERFRDEIRALPGPDHTIPLIEKLARGTQSA